MPSQHVMDSTPDNNASVCWNTNDQDFPEYYPAIMRLLRDGEVEYTAYVERLTTNIRAQVCCCSDNHATVMEQGTLPRVGTFENPLLLKDLPKVPKPPATPPPAGATPDPAKASGSSAPSTSTSTSSTSEKRSRFIDAPEAVEKVSREIVRVICSTITDARYCDGLRKKYNSGPEGAALLLTSFTDKKNKLDVDSHQSTLSDLDALLNGGFAEPSLQAVIDLTTAVDDKNDTLPDSSTLRLRLQDVTSSEGVHVSYLLRRARVTCHAH